MQITRAQYVDGINRLKRRLFPYPYRQRLQKVSSFFI